VSKQGENGASKQAEPGAGSKPFRRLDRRRLVIASMATPVVLKLGMRTASGQSKKKKKSGHTSTHSSVKKKKR